MLVPKRKLWEEQAAPMKEFLLPALYGLRDAGMRRGAALAVIDYTVFGGYGSDKPSVEVYFEHDGTDRKTNRVRIQALGDGLYYATESEQGDCSHTYRPLPEDFALTKAPLDERAVKSLLEYIVLSLVIVETTPLSSKKRQHFMPRRPSAMAV